MKSLYVLLLLAVMTGCTTVKHNGRETFVESVDFPASGEVMTASVGENLVLKGTKTEESVLLQVQEPINGALYEIPAIEYRHLGYDERQDFYSSVGVVRGLLADPVQALSLKKYQGSEVCIITIFGMSVCYQGKFERRRELSESGDNFQKALIFSGLDGNELRIGYREFEGEAVVQSADDEARFNLASSDTIEYKGAVLEVLKASDNSITYKVLRSFD